MTATLPAASPTAPTTTADPVRSIGVGIDTARYGHRVNFLRDDRQLAAPPIDVAENQAGYQRLRRELERLQRRHPQVQFRVHIDAAGQYAANLERFLRGLPLPLTISVGEPKRNKDYHRATSPKRTSDDTESRAMARFGVVEQPAPTPATPPEFAVLREVASRLRAQAKDTTRAFNRLHNLLSRVFPELVLLLSKLRAQWVLDLLEKYPTPGRIAAARLDSLKKIPRIKAALAEKIQQAARESVASLTGELAEGLVQDLIGQLRQCLNREKSLGKLLLRAFDALPRSGHVQVLSIPGIGRGTAAVLVAKIVDIGRFATAENVVGYFGVFPEEDSSGVDRAGRPLAPGTVHMSRQGCDLVRHYLWNAAKSAARHNPAVRALYDRLVARGTSRCVALGHCMRKLLHQVFGVWTSDTPFDAEHHAPRTGDRPAEGVAGEGAGPQPLPQPPKKETAAGHKRELIPESRVVTAAASHLASHLEPVPGSVPVSVPCRAEGIDYGFLREQIDLERVLAHLGVRSRLRPRGRGQWRGDCPLCGSAGDAFSVSFARSIYQCFQAGCSSGNVLDFWMHYQRLPLFEAAQHLAETFGLQTQRNPKAPSR